MIIKPAFLVIMLISILPCYAQENDDFIRVKDLSADFIYDMRYATANNFLKEKVYECADCVLRKEVGEALVKANSYFLKKGYKIKFFDCYRPLDVQKAMWKVLPDGRYVANPNSGSIHNRGGAVDITLTDLQGNELDMGTDFDYFGEKAHFDYSDLPEQIISNRKLLKTGLELFGFQGIRTEWWHYNYSKARQYSLSNFKTNCD
ncbi:M15 family metallopeptidase [Fulvivirga maritima]|uniref:M15 family metallopeptidase n=1 Tax=Fulvivirga maritima TaxID=2904247 RepID=UPI001F2DB699|nr:M15 family metallopeptidase [Fulvivirga maritima]UII26244.1 M15 family metallopeptidase [Fulvivirga maritima]